MNLRTEDMHELVEADVEYFTQHGFPVQGVVHVGANVGQELPWYLAHTYMPILAFEPHPEAFKELYRIYGKVAICSPFALGAEMGQLTLLIPEDGDTQRGSKFHPIETEGHDWTVVPMTSEIKVPIVRFDVWLENHLHLINIKAYNTLVIDVQGMELEVLKGFGKYLDNFSLMVVECSARPVYDGEASAQEVIDFLSTKGFMSITPILGHDDILFRRRGLFD